MEFEWPIMYDLWHSAALANPLVMYMTTSGEPWCLLVEGGSVS